MGGLLKGGEANCVVTRAGRTELTLLQQGLGTRASRDDHERGWTSALGKLARYVSEAKA